MSTDIESQSDTLMAQMHKLQNKVIDSFKKTDELLDYYGLSRSELRTVMTKVRRRMSESELETLNNREVEWTQNIKSELQANRSNSETSDRSVKQATKRMRTALMHKI